MHNSIYLVRRMLILHPFAHVCARLTDAIPWVKLTFCKSGEVGDLSTCHDLSLVQSSNLHCQSVKVPSKEQNENTKLKKVLAFVEVLENRNVALLLAQTVLPFYAEFSVIKAR